MPLVITGLQVAFYPSLSTLPACLTFSACVLGFCDYSWDGEGSNFLQSIFICYCSASAAQRLLFQGLYCSTGKIHSRLKLAI